MKNTLKEEIRSLRKEVRHLAFLELAVVAVLLGLVVSAAVPRYSGYIKRARATEAVSRLSAIMTASKLFYQKTGHWPQSPEAIGYYADFSSTEHFTYDIGPFADDGRFTLQAIGKNIDGMEDVTVLMSCSNPSSQAMIEFSGKLKNFNQTTAD
jgi:type II secretory pathway pseudopilin PulG